MNDRRACLAIDGRQVEITVSRPPRARRLRLKIDPVSGDVGLVLPLGTRLTEGLRFAAAHGDWIAARLDNIPPAAPFVHGSRVPYLGTLHRLVHTGRTRGTVERAGGEIRVGGRPEHLPRRVTDWLKREARRELSARARRRAAEVDRRVAAVSIRDTRSRWGSCAASGRLSFSWRLVMAPDWVMDYVVCHEVAHLVEPHHGPAFWALVDCLTPDAARARAWLREEGPRLLRYGRG